MHNLDLQQLPSNARKELKDFYEFLLSKYGQNKDNKPYKNRPYGLAKGEIEISDDFDEPLPKDIEDEIYN